MATTNKTITKYHRQKDADRNFQNWIKASLVLSFVKEGITKCVDARICMWHGETLYPEGKGQPCSECTTENVLLCKTKSICVINKGQCRFHNSEEKKFKPCSCCTKVKDVIVKSHVNRMPSWSNTRANRWYNSPWEIAKCFMPPKAYSHADSAEVTDLNGILSVIISHKIFRDMFDSDECEHIRTMVNGIRHTADTLLTEEELNDTIRKMTDFLSSSEHLRRDGKAKEALRNIEQIRSAQVTISSNEISSILQEVIEKNSNLCQNMNKLLSQAIEILDKERTQELQTLETIFTLLKDILLAVQCITDVKQTIPTTSASTPKPMTEQEYQDTKQRLKSDLIKFNNQRHSSILLSPLFGESDTRLVDFYVFPQMEIVDNQQVLFRGRPNEKRKCVTSLREIFFKLDKPCQEIYVTSESGIGKTAFCKRLSVTWCHANQKNKTRHFSEEDLQVMQRYDFLFLVLLRDTVSSSCKIEEMIQNQIIQHLDHSNRYTVDVLEEILSRESCLIVLDGLDEWYHSTGDTACKAESSDIPHRKSWEYSTILTTSRPWKFNDLSLKSSQVDQVIEIQKLDTDIANKLTLNTLSKLNEDETGKSNASKIQTDAVKFSNEIGSKSIRSFTSVPLILTYLVCLWHVYGQSLGRSKYEIYCNLIGLLLNEAEQRQYSISSSERSCHKKIKLHIPNQIAANEFCKKHYEFLLKVGRLAFETYFAYNREKSFAFEKGAASKILTDHELKFCFDVGFLTQSKHLNSNISKRSKLSFREQTLQEFFAVLYMQSVNAFSRVVRTISLVCNSVESILPISNILIFLSGLCPKKASVLSKTLSEMASLSDIARGYRSDMGSWNYFVGYNKAMKAYQSMHVACIEEFRENFTDGKHSIKLYLEDYFIDIDFEDKKYSCFLEALLEMNKTQIKSIKVRDVKTKKGFHEIMDTLERHKINSLEKIDIKCEVDEVDLENLLACSANCLKCFIFKGGKWENNEWQHSYKALSENSLVSITNTKQLEELYLRNIEMTHHQIERLVTYISKQKNMKHIGLSFIKCSEHSESCPGIEVDLQKHAELKMIEIGDAPFSKIDLNTDCLEVCYIGPLKHETAYSSVLKSISEAPKLRVFCSGFMEIQILDI
ncbi:uncharacterized protein LOC132732885 [Ruditapes philippinarum]|uniref:uncharacterized protein LOC132732885 n=1 Tax=Ruditapes philippinarum TaxID=129788 RepID=UPI00295A7354|nr:uncharacterized protein LOC132732885 [Ruditapes philippinarum]XP_060575395.1 uncharacterized protein LOC132732885 [Ruditapes philippinarum]XP_060575397.1 uncharacterized protein LOC132732885 [Ruditapes philippinarum]XP_060575398.1 uncharacterized protein LOC132732885 [Ruditapes philippinarum]